MSLISAPFWKRHKSQFLRYDAHKVAFDRRMLLCIFRKRVSCDASQIARISLSFTLNQFRNNATLPGSNVFLPTWFSYYPAKYSATMEIFPEAGLCHQFLSGVAEWVNVLIFAFWEKRFQKDLLRSNRIFLSIFEKEMFANHWDLQSFLLNEFSI